MITEDNAEALLRALIDAADEACLRFDLADVEAHQLKFVAAIYLVGTVAQRTGLSKEYAASRVAEILPRAMDASEGDQHIDIHRGGVPS